MIPVLLYIAIALHCHFDSFSLNCISMVMVIIRLHYNCNPSSNLRSKRHVLTCREKQKQQSALGMPMTLNIIVSTESASLHVSSRVILGRIGGMEMHRSNSGGRGEIWNSQSLLQGPKKCNPHIYIDSTMMWCNPRRTKRAFFPPLAI